MVGQAGASSSYASTFTVGSFSYDVFLNFRGEDTRKGFTGHLYRALHRERINVFMDNHKLWEGEEIGPKLVEAIQGSKISIPIFSKGYADSKWCLMELAQIVECHKSNHQIVLPIFFDVEPSDVRHQTGSFEEVFLEHERNFNLHIVEEWREALRKVGSLKGWNLNAVENGDESKLIELVVERALRETRSIHLSDVKYPVGLDSRVNDLLSLLNSGSKDVRFVGICGEGGIGKTTIAKALYNGILQSFHQNCFLANIREEALGPNGLVSLQEKLIYSISKRKVVGEILNVDNGKEMIKRRCQGENVLLVLDDVDHCSQLFALAVDLNWFGQGSRVIITTRDEHILNVANVDTDKIYWPKELDTNQSLELFAWHAFQKHQPFEEYMELSHQIACYSGGLPLTLEVLGSYLSDIHDKEVWKSTLQKLREIPLKEVYERLKISYDNLEDDYQKAIFLDVACFFIGWEKKCVISIWEACGYHPKSAIKKLIQRSLLKVTEDKFLSSMYYLQMHDQIRDMGREIVLQESRMEPGRRSRLWSLDEILEVVEEHKGTHNIKGILLSSKRHNQLSSSGPQFPTVYISSEYFENMSGLRFLHVDGADSKGDFPRLPYGLRWFSWKRCPLKDLPANFYHKRLVHLDLSHSRIEQAWNIMPQNEYKLEKIQGLEGIESLESFVVIGCYNVTATPRKQYFQLGDRIDDGLERDDEPTELKIHSFVNENDGIRKGLFLIIVFAFSSNLKETLQEGELVHIELDIYTTIFGKDGNETYCQHTIILENVEFTTERDIIYIHDLEGFTWFGFSLEGKDAMKELRIESCGIYKLSTDDYCHCRNVKFKFWSLRQYIINEESGEDMLNHYALIGKLEFRFVKEEVDTE